MNPKIRHEHLGRGAVVYVRQSTMTQVQDHTESRRSQYALADSARSMGFAEVDTIDDDLGRSGSGIVDRPGFQRLVARVCTASVGAVFCIEASRLARNGRDWHHLIDLCALVGTLVIDPDGIYDPRLVNDRLLLGLKGTMSEYELSLLRQRATTAINAKAKRGELRVGLPPGFCWNDSGKIEIDADQRVADAIRGLLRKFRELGSALQALHWARDAGLQVPVTRRYPGGTRVEWHSPAYHNILRILQNPHYAGAYTFGKTENRTHIIDDRAHRTSGHKKPRERWSVLLRDHHDSYISWAEYEDNQRMLSENAHMQKRAARKSGRGGSALLTGLLRCGSCGRMLQVHYGASGGNAHRYICRGEADRGAAAYCLGVGGVRLDQAVSLQLLEAVAPKTIEIALEAANRAGQLNMEQKKALTLALEEARYEASLAARRHAAVDPDKRLVARELEARWEVALVRVRELELRIQDLETSAAARQRPDAAALKRLADDLPAVWNATSSDPALKQRIVRTLIREVVVGRDDPPTAILVSIHWVGGRHTRLRVARVSSRSTPAQRPTAVDAIRKMGGRWPDREVAVAMNRMRCKGEDGGTSWTITRVRAVRERLGIPAWQPSSPATHISVREAARRLGVAVPSVHRLIRTGALPATQCMRQAPWEVPLAALDSEAVRIGVREIAARRPRKYKPMLEDGTPRLPGL